MAGRRGIVAAKNLADSKQLLTRKLALVDELQGSSTPRDVIYAAFHSGFVRTPLENDPAPHNHWINPAASARLARVVMRGFEIVQKTA